MARVCVFAGSSPGSQPQYAAAADALGRAIARRGWGVVYGGGAVGLMGVLADAALEAGGEVIGVIPEALRVREVAHGRLTDLQVVASMHERKALMGDLADAFIALPGGFGTLEELCEVLTWAQLGIHAKAVCTLNVDSFYDPLLSFLDAAVARGFVRDAHRALLLVAASPEEALDRCAAWTPAADVPRWMDRGAI